eukprot:scaffold4737_cov105-Isochrysis_galbana.AAC.2
MTKGSVLTKIKSKCGLYVGRMCSSGFLEPRTSKIYLLAGPLAQKGHWQVPETGHGPHRRSFQDLRQISNLHVACADVEVVFIRLLEHRTSKIYVLAVTTVLPNHMPYADYSNIPLARRPPGRPTRWSFDSGGACR